MSDEADWEEEEPVFERPFGAKPFSSKPFGAKPFGAKPFSSKPFGAKPFGAKPFSSKPFGAKPFGAKPFSSKPFSSKLLGDGGGFDADEWSADIAELVFERSAAIRAGATLVFGGDELQVPVSNPVAGIRAPGSPGPAPAPVAPITLHPGEWMLEASVVAPLALAAASANSPDAALPIKVDLADALALGLDQSFLVGAKAPGGPQGVGLLVSGVGPAGGGGQIVQRLRGLAAGIRAARPASSPGWIIHPAALTATAEFITATGVLAAPANGRAADTFPVVTYDGVDGGTLLGYPFLTSTAALAGNVPGAFFSADWREAWLGFDATLVSVHTGPTPAAGAAAAPGQLVVTASMPLDMTLRQRPAFGWTAV